MPELYLMNELPEAAEWLSRIFDIECTEKKLVEACCNGNIQLIAIIPGWKMPGHGEIKWYLDNEGGTDDGHAVESFISDGCIPVTSTMARTLLTHGKCSLGYARLQTFTCAPGGGQLNLPSIALRGGPNSEMIGFNDVRVTKTSLNSYVDKLRELAQPDHDKSHTTIPRREAQNLPAGVTAQELIEKFKLPKKWKNILSHIDRCKYLKKSGAVIQQGCRKSSTHGAGMSNLFNPVKFAEMLMAREGKTLKQMRTIIEHRFPKWQDAWDDAQSIDESEVAGLVG